MKNTRKILALILALVLSFSLMAGCGNTSATTATEAPTATEAAATEAPAATEEPVATEEPAPEYITITDMAGNECTIPSTINRVVIDQVPLYASYVLYMGGTADKLVGIAQSNLDTLDGSILINIAPELDDCDTSFNTTGDLNIEELINLKPDVVLYNAGNEEHRQLFEQAGIPCVGFNTTNGETNDPVELYTGWLRTLEKVFQEPGKMDECINWGTDLINSIHERTDAIADADKANVLILFNYGKGTPRVAGGQKHFGQGWLKEAGVINAAEEVTGVAECTLEQIYNWDPDVIIMPGPGQCSITPKQVIENTVEGADFSPLTAVKEGKVYSNSLGSWSWYVPNCDAPVILAWIAQCAYPDLFADFDLRALASEYYHNFYNYDLSESELDFLFDRDTSK